METSRSAVVCILRNYVNIIANNRTARIYTCVHSISLCCHRWESQSSSHQDPWWKPDLSFYLSSGNQKLLIIIVVIEKNFYHRLVSWQSSLQVFQTSRRPCKHQELLFQYDLRENCNTYLSAKFFLPQRILSEEKMASKQTGREVVGCALPNPRGSLFPLWYWNSGSSSVPQLLRCSIVKAVHEDFYYVSKFLQFRSFFRRQCFQNVSSCNFFCYGMHSACDIHTTVKQDNLEIWPKIQFFSVLEYTYSNYASGDIWRSAIYVDLSTPQLKKWRRSCSYQSLNIELLLIHITDRKRLINLPNTPIIALSVLVILLLISERYELCTTTGSLC